MNAQTKSDNLITPEDTYNLLLTQLQIYSQYTGLSENSIDLLREATELAGKGEFETAILYVETLIEQNREIVITNANQSEYDISKKENTNASQRWEVSVISGIDFNRHDFETGYLETDSKLVEEINKPYAGITSELNLWQDQKSRLDLENSLRYDNENFRDDLKLTGQLNQTWSGSYSTYLSRATNDTLVSFWEHQFKTKAADASLNNFHWYFNNLYEYKTYQNSSSGLSDFFRNRAEIQGEWNILPGWYFNGKYSSEINETLGNKNNDYSDHTFEIGYRRSDYFSLSHSLSLQGSLRNYSLVFADSIIKNRYTEWGAIVNIGIPVVSSLRTEVENEFSLKNYNHKSSLEPDYSWNLLKPTVTYSFTENFETGIGYEMEIKRHSAISSDDLDVREQDYSANGLEITANYFRPEGVNLSFAASYQWRRYPQSVTNDLFSLYSDRNVFTVYLLVYIPVSDHLNLDIFATYDNDNDIDLEQQNNQSTIISAEFEYRF